VLDDESYCAERINDCVDGVCTITKEECVFTCDPPPETSEQGTVRWVGPPAAYAEDTAPVSPGFVAAPLQGEPYYRDWSEAGLAAGLPATVCPHSPPDCGGCYGAPDSCVSVDTNLVHVFGGEVMPCSEYDVQVIHEECDETDESS
jgi:hypothetical protein